MQSDSSERMIAKSQAGKSVSNRQSFRLSTRKSFHASPDDESRLILRDENSSTIQTHVATARPSLSARADVDEALATRPARTLLVQSSLLHATHATCSRHSRATQSRAAPIRQPQERGHSTNVFVL